MKEKIARWFKQGLWTEQMVLNAVLKNVLTAEEADIIINGEKALIIVNNTDSSSWSSFISELTTSWDTWTINESKLGILTSFSNIISNASIFFL